jgi:hypothetical protein
MHTYLKPLFYMPNISGNISMSHSPSSPPGNFSLSRSVPPSRSLFLAFASPKRSGLPPRPLFQIHPSSWSGPPLHSSPYSPPLPPNPSTPYLPYPFASNQSHIWRPTSLSTSKHRPTQRDTYSIRSQTSTTPIHCPPIPSKHHSLSSS